MDLQWIHSHTQSHLGAIDHSQFTYQHVLKQWEETGKPWGNLHRHNKDMWKSKEMWHAIHQWIGGGKSLIRINTNTEFQARAGLVHLYLILIYFYLPSVHQGLYSVVISLQSYHMHKYTNFGTSFNNGLSLVLRDKLIILYDVYSMLESKKSLQALHDYIMHLPKLV